MRIFSGDRIKKMMHALKLPKNVPIENILGHNEVNKNTVCPGNGFIGGWKLTLINLIKKNISSSSPFTYKQTSNS